MLRKAVLNNDYETVKNIIESSFIDGILALDINDVDDTVTQ